ncbi:MAG: hypothetical protein A2498_08125 [Lentisphaerae bacterium RIFOXYC12_FULL_60_16]|nr:MAG: hypothetical protein A2498_08125 [Lentisphaerae bacterium RIFOXYC12_FULL_60_16]OGV79724.1 MAG: hypothetical protein A2340_14695 [Lentisphaerae bacterium RIFOXYB12_FULL_60_10]
MKLDEAAEMTRAVLDMKPAKGIPQWLIHVMEIGMIEQVAGVEKGAYVKEPERVYLQFQRNAATTFIDQYIPTNPMSMTDHGYDSGSQRGATTGAQEIVRDGIVIDSPESVCTHLEQFVFPQLRQAIADFRVDDEAAVEALIAGERKVQDEFGPSILKVPYGGFFSFPGLAYGHYGYEAYFCAYALYPEVMEQYFKLSADLAVKRNTVAARAIIQGGLPRVLRLDHDMADSRGTLVREETLDQIWFPHFARSIEPLLKAGIRLLWHCDGNLMKMVPRLIEAGIGGFQGFQYEDGMDYIKICGMKTRDGAPLMIWAGVSVTRTLPWGTSDDVTKEMKWLVDNGPRVGLVLGGSSSMAPGVPLANIRAMIAGRTYYRTHGRG